MFFLSTALNPACLSTGISFTFSPVLFFLLTVYSAFTYIYWGTGLYSTLAVHSLPACSMYSRCHFFFFSFEVLCLKKKKPQTKPNNLVPALSNLCQEVSLGLFHLLCSGFFTTLFPPHIFAFSPWAVLYKQLFHINLRTPLLFISKNWCCWEVSQY